MMRLQQLEFIRQAISSSNLRKLPAIDWTWSRAAATKERHANCQTAGNGDDDGGIIDERRADDVFDVPDLVDDVVDSTSGK
jgi:hypothetical protein